VGLENILKDDGDMPGAEVEDLLKTQSALIGDKLR
jgi:hypothetical protein